MKHYYHNDYYCYKYDYIQCKCWRTISSYIKIKLEPDIREFIIIKNLQCGMDVEFKEREIEKSYYIVFTFLFVLCVSKC